MPRIVIGQSPGKIVPRSVIVWPSFQPKRAAVLRPTTQAVRSRRNAASSSSASTISG